MATLAPCIDWCRQATSLLRSRGDGSWFHINRFAVSNGSWLHLNRFAVPSTTLNSRWNLDAHLRLINYEAAATAARRW